MVDTVEPNYYLDIIYKDGRTKDELMPVINKAFVSAGSVGGIIGNY